MSTRSVVATNCHAMQNTAIAEKTRSTWIMFDTSLLHSHFAPWDYLSLDISRWASTQFYSPSCWLERAKQISVLKSHSNFIELSRTERLTTLWKIIKKTKKFPLIFWTNKICRKSNRIWTWNGWTFWIMKKNSRKQRCKISMIWHFEILRHNFPKIAWILLVQAQRMFVLTTKYNWKTLAIDTITSYEMYENIEARTKRIPFNHSSRVGEPFKITRGNILSELSEPSIPFK